LWNAETCVIEERSFRVFEASIFAILKKLQHLQKKAFYDSKISSIQQPSVNIFFTATLFVREKKDLISHFSQARSEQKWECQ
jgi:hypothetical protein